MLRIIEKKTQVINYEKRPGTNVTPIFFSYKFVRALHFMTYTVMDLFCHNLLSNIISKFK